jgi:hypothetical protein
MLSRAEHVSAAILSLQTHQISLSSMETSKTESNRFVLDAPLNGWHVGER